MIFTTFTSQNIRLAALSERGDGDCGWRGPENRRAFLEAHDADPEQLICPRLTHGTRLIQVTHAHIGTPCDTAIGDADGVFTSLRGIPLGIPVADCVPVWIVAHDAACGALVHAGREGTRLHIAETATRTLCEAFAVRPERLHALIGPSAGPCCYEVSPDLAAQCAAEGIPARGRNLDLWTANSQQLETGGLIPENIHIAGICTLCTQRFFSYRRGDAHARNLAVLVL